MDATTYPANSLQPAVNNHEGPFSAEDGFWLIRLRWFALLGVLAVVGWCFWFNLLETIPQLLLIIAVMAATNLLLWFVLRSRVARGAPASPVNVVAPQLVLDLVALVLLLHYAGGVENPFVMFFSFHMSIGAMFLRPRLAWSVGVGGGLIHAGVVMGEFLELVPHHHMAFAYGVASHPNLHTMPAFIGAYLGAFSLMLGGVIYFVQKVAERTRYAEAKRQEHERIALSRERLARIGEISAGVSHAIRNPLHGLINCVSLLSQKAPMGDIWVREKCDLMAEGLQRIDRVTQRLLVLSRETPLRLVPTDLEALLRDVIRFVEGPANRREVQLTVELEPIPPFQLDPDRFGEVLINLLENALAASPLGGLITVNARKVVKPMPWVLVEIADNGSGIPPEISSKIFDPFFTTKEVGEGSGLGLAIARQVVEGHGGQITLNSGKGTGTTVKVQVPFNAGDSG